jgi:hypothetical protein
MTPVPHRWRALSMKWKVPPNSPPLLQKAAKRRQDAL